jgi:two-component system chemotaxis sensor kinase CheA
VDDLTKEFLAESSEGLDRMEQCLTELEQRPRDAGLLGEVFRAVHTIKGTTGFLGFSRLERLAHAGESLLGMLRDGQLVADAMLISGLLQLMDGLREILKVIDRTGHEGRRSDDDDCDLVSLLERLADPSRSVGPQSEQGAPPQLPVPENGLVLAKAPPGGAHAIALPEDENARVVARAATAPAGQLEVAGRQPVEPGGAAPAASGSQSVLEKTLRIDVEVLNRMMNLVGELVLTRNQILQSHVDAELFPLLARRLDTVTADLRETVMQARMQPVGHLFGKFPRMVRDLAQSCGKQVRLEFSGESTGLDKSLLEAIKDPLTHAVRNSVDHGIETPGVRLARGKAAEGTIRLTACHQSGSVVIELSDDGGGIAQQRVLAKAIERKLVTPEQAAQMTPRETLQLIFLPGFSTAAAVTKVSGRGVGMDVVRANVEGVGGTVEVDSQEGVGTTLRLRVPLTLAIVPALVVRSGGQSFCLPQGSLAELVYIPLREAAKAIEHVGDAELYRLRDQLLPMVWLDRVLCLDGARAAGQLAEPHGYYVAVLETDGCRFGLVVDDLMAPEEIVVKPLSNVLRAIGLFSGATVLGNGALAMILDVAATAARAHVRPVVEAHGASKLIGGQAAAGGAGSANTEKEPAFLIYEDAADRHSSLRERHAVPLEVVERIETVRLAEVERVGGRWLLQHRGDLLSLEDPGGALERAFTLDADQPLNADGSRLETLLAVLICEREAMRTSAGRALPALTGQPGLGGSRRTGLVVDRVIDVATGSLVAGAEWACKAPLALVKGKLVTLNQNFAPAMLEVEVTPVDAVLTTDKREQQTLLAEVA